MVLRTVLNSAGLGGCLTRRGESVAGLKEPARLSGPENLATVSLGKVETVKCLLHLDGNGFGEFEAEGRLGGQDNLFLPGVRRSRGSRPGT
jgi:hypothetical protein